MTSLQRDSGARASLYDDEMADGSLPSNIYTRSNGQLHAPGMQKDRLNMTVIDNYGMSGQKSNSKTEKLAAAYGGGVAMTPSTT